VKVDEILRMWKEDSPTDITEKPLPDPETLNAQIPVSEWEEGVDGRPRPPWAHYVVVYLVDPERRPSTSMPRQRLAGTSRSSS